MSYADLIRLYFERSDALQWLWTLYVIVIGGLLAFSSLRQRPDLVTAALVTVLYCCFAYKNLGAIGDVTMQRQAVLDSIRQRHERGADTANTGQLRQTPEEHVESPDRGHPAGERSGKRPDKARGSEGPAARGQRGLSGFISLVLPHSLWNAFHGMHSMKRMQ